MIVAVGLRVELIKVFRYQRCKNKVALWIPTECEPTAGHMIAFLQKVLSGKASAQQTRRGFKIYLLVHRNVSISKML